MAAKFKNGDWVSFHGSTSWGRIVLSSNLDKNSEDIWVKPICGTPRWMNPPRGGKWLIKRDTLREIVHECRELCELLYGEV